VLLQLLASFPRTAINESEALPNLNPLSAEKFPCRVLRQWLSVRVCECLRWWWRIHLEVQPTTPIRELRAAPSDLDSFNNRKHKPTVVKIEQSSVKKRRKIRRTKLISSVKLD